MLARLFEKKGEHYGYFLSSYLFKASNPASYQIFLSKLRYYVSNNRDRRIWDSGLVEKWKVETK